MKNSNWTAIKANSQFSLFPYKGGVCVACSKCGHLRGRWEPSRPPSARRKSNSLPPFALPPFFFNPHISGLATNQPVSATVPVLGRSDIWMCIFFTDWLQLQWLLGFNEKIVLSHSPSYNMCQVSFKRPPLQGIGWKSLLRVLPERILTRTLSLLTGLHYGWRCPAFRTTWSSVPPHANVNPNGLQQRVFAFAIRSLLSFLMWINHFAHIGGQRTRVVIVRCKCLKR